MRPWGSRLGISSHPPRAVTSPPGPRPGGRGRLGARTRLTWPRTAAAAGSVDSPRLEAVVVPLPGDLAVAELQEDREPRPHLPPGGDAAEGDGQRPRPLNLQGDLIPAGDRVEHFVALGGHDLAAPLGGFPEAGQVAPRPLRDEPVRELLLQHVVREEREAAPRLPALDGLQVAA